MFYIACPVTYMKAAPRWVFPLLFLARGMLTLKGAGWTLGAETETEAHPGKLGSFLLC